MTKEKVNYSAQRMASAIARDLVTLQISGLRGLKYAVVSECELRLILDGITKKQKERAEKHGG